MRTTMETRFRALCCIMLAGLACVPLTGCIAFGYSSGGGWFIWPGGLGLIVLILIVIFVLRRRSDKR